MTKTINDLLEIEDSYKAPDKIMKLILNDETKKEFFNKLMKIYNYDMSYDWFHEYFQEDHADRKNKKQDFTPNSVADVLSEMLGDEKLKGIIYEPSAGTGGTLIRKWWNDRSRQSFLEYNPDSFIMVCHELSDRAIPFLLTNIAIRGINAVVIHGNTLTGEVKNIYQICNVECDYLGFSKIIKVQRGERNE